MSMGGLSYGPAESDEERFKVAIHWPLLSHLV